MQAVGSVDAVLALSGGMGRSAVRRELAAAGELPRWIDLWFFWIRWVVPVAVIIALLSGWLG